MLAVHPDAELVAVDQSAEVVALAAGALADLVGWLTEAGLSPAVVWQHRDLVVVVADLDVDEAEGVGGDALVVG